MGTSVLLVFLAPVMAAYILFGGAFEAVFGSPTEKVVLPYDESKGMVWEYDNVDDPYITLKEVQIKGDEQIFVFENSEGIFAKLVNIVEDIFSDPDYEGTVMDLIFTDENGNTKTFYASEGSMLSAPDIFASEECLVTQYTITTENPAESGVWRTILGSEYVLVKKSDVSPSATFTIVKMPVFSEEKFSVNFFYSNNVFTFEEVTTSFVITETDGITVKNEYHQFR